MTKVRHNFRKQDLSKMIETSNSESKGAIDFNSQDYYLDNLNKDVFSHNYISFQASRISIIYKSIFAYHLENEKYFFIIRLICLLY